MQLCCRLVLLEANFVVTLLTAEVEGVIAGFYGKLGSQVTSHYESTRLDIWNCRVDRVRLSIEVLQVVAEKVCNMSSSRVKSLRVNMTRHLE